MPTYPVAPAEKSSIFFRGEAYRGASSHYYPLKLNDNNNSKKVFEQLVEEANQQLKSLNISEAGVIFGEQEAENVRKSRYHTMKGLGYKGLKKMKQANEYLKQAVELSYSNLWAKVELESY